MHHVTKNPPSPPPPPSWVSRHCRLLLGGGGGGGGGGLGKGEKILCLFFYSHTMDHCAKLFTKTIKWQNESFCCILKANWRGGGEGVRSIGAGTERDRDYISGLYCVWKGVSNKFQIQMLLKKTELGTCGFLLWMATFTGEEDLWNFPKDVDARLKEKFMPRKFSVIDTNNPDASHAQNRDKSPDTEDIDRYIHVWCASIVTYFSDFTM